MKTMKKIALVALGLIEFALPVALMLAGCFVSNVNTFWCLVLIACAIVYIVIEGAWFHGTIGGRKDWAEFLQKTALFGAIGAFLPLCLEFLYLGYITRHFPACPNDIQPFGISLCYLFSVMSVMLLVVDDWKKQDGKTKFFLTCAEIICASIAIMAGISCIDIWFGLPIGDTVGNIFGYIVGTTIIVLIGGIACVLAAQAMNYSNNLTERWASACGTVICTGFVLMMLTGVLSGWGVNIPDALRNALLWLIGGGFIALILTAIVALIKK
jgi:hypothetical protein